MVQEVDPSHESRLWDKYHSQSDESKVLRKGVTTAFLKLFPEGHKTSIRRWVEAAAYEAALGTVFKGNFEDFNNIHPRAWPLLLQYGKDYRPRIELWKKHQPQTWTRQPVQSACHNNAYTMMHLMRDGKLKGQDKTTYVEGVAISPIVNPILHAWNGYGFSRRGFDWTLYTRTNWIRYFGIPFTFEEYLEIRKGLEPERAQKIRLIFKRDDFERLEDKLLEVLERRPRTRFPTNPTAGVS